MAETPTTGDQIIALNGFILAGREIDERRKIAFDGLTVDDWVEVVDPQNPATNGLMGEAALLGTLAHGFMRSKSPNMLRRGKVAAIYPHPQNFKQMVYEVLLEGNAKPTGIARTRLRKLNLLEVIAYEVHLAEKEDEAKAGG
jgi:hypothetical protein